MTRTTLFVLLLSALAGWFGAGEARPSLGAVFEEEGCNADPDGRGAPITATADEGCNADPNGHPVCKPGG